MLESIQSWLSDLENEAVKMKKEANAKGEKYIWRSQCKNKDIKNKFSEKCKDIAPISGHKLSSRSKCTQLRKRMAL